MRAVAKNAGIKGTLIEYWNVMHGRLWIRPALAVMLTAGMSGGFAGATAAEAATTCQAWGAQPVNVNASSMLRAVAVTSSCNAWAAGSDFDGSVPQTLIEHWNGTAWKVQASANPAGSSDTLAGIAAASSSRAWAVGSYDNNAGVTRTLIEQWNGTAWKVRASPDAGAGDNFLVAATATSASNAWAVGHYHTATHDQTLIEHWDGTSWKRVPSPDPGGSANDDILYSVAASSATSAWAVGYHSNGTVVRTLIEHWNGTAWKVVPSPNAGTSTDDFLQAVSGTSGSAWAVGWYLGATSRRTLIEHWNGTAWKVVPSPSAGTGDNFLWSVDATSAANAWAVGWYQTSAGGFLTLLERWNGSAWRRIPTPSPGGPGNTNTFWGVAGTGCGNAWIVGYYSNGINNPLALHC